MSAPYFPQVLFAPIEERAVRGVVAPQRYMQGPGVLERLGRALQVMSVSHAAVLISPNGIKRFGQKIQSSLADVGLAGDYAKFDGECSLEHIERSVAELSERTPSVDCLVAVGGGKCIDAGKAIAFRLGVPIVVVPTLASTDAPCSAVSVLYTPEGVVSGAEFFPENPACVLMDTEILIASPARYLVAGMGDALATWYEARTCQANSDASSVLGCRPTLAASKIGELSSQTIYARGAAALDAAKSGRLNDAFEDVVEANTLHSGLGFESGGLAAAHAVASGLTFVPKVDEAAMHGEMVALGILTQLVLESDEAEYEKAQALFMTVGLPVHFGQVALELEADETEFETFVAATCGYPTMANMAMPVDGAMLKRAVKAVDERGRAAVAHDGDAAFQSLR